MKKNSDQSNLKDFADSKMDLTEKSIFAVGRMENIVEKGENAGYSVFSFFHNVFKKYFF